ncbi:hypothetical protein T552_02921 [Pneumocystis carinii B80]|uniref:FK506-binding protein n=1 Tax=Pneumocystis carinii (strain B80) TaxID=1408658 RepID=A0A0W4ZDP5_PNEC8|nr:hypothetical protein T552_02921 [Pneumocystis carinii B80]KTW26442.1 hypothetical protein T552_02921 [Pneumocystis carinii B80]
MAQAVALWGCKVEPGKRVPAHDNEDTAGAFRLTMAAIDSSDKSFKSSTIKVIRRPRFHGDDDNIDDSDDISESDLKELEVEFVLCTLKHGDQYQQSLDLTFSADEEVFFTTSGDCPVYLTGNHVILSDFDDYDISSDEDELFDKYSDDLDANDSESGELDDDSPKIEELSSSESKVSDSEKKINLSDNGLDDLDDLDDLDSVSRNNSNKQDISKKRILDTGDVDISKLSKKQRRKLKLNSDKSSSEAKGESNVFSKNNSSESRNFQNSKPSVSFAKDLDQSSTKTSKSKVLEGGVVIEDKVVGKGPQVKDGCRVGLRYIGRLLNGKQFDSNTKGKPFTFVVGSGEVIKGWDIGIKGMSLGGQRRITVPCSMAYGKKALSGIPAGSDLVFEVKLVKMN